MPSGYSKNLGLELMLTGENAGTWGEVTNINLSAIDDAIDGVVDIVVGPGGLTLATANAPALSDGRSRVLSFTGNLGEPPASNVTVTIDPSDAEKNYFIRNQTNGPLVFAQGSGARYTVNSGYSAMIHCDGRGLEASVYGTLSSLQCDKLIVKGPAEVTGTISIAGAVTLKETVTLEKALTVAGLSTFGEVQVNSTLKVTGKVTTNNALDVLGATMLRDTLEVTGDAQINGALTAVGAATMRSTLDVTEMTTLAGVTAGAVTAASLSVSPGAATLGGGCAVTGDLTVTGLISANGNLKVTVGSDAANDMYYRAASGALARVPQGAAGQFLRTQGGGDPAWQWGDPPPADSITIGCPVYNFSGVPTGNILYVGNDGPPNFAASLHTEGLFFDAAGNGFLELHTTNIMGLKFNSTLGLQPYQTIMFDVKGGHRWEVGTFDATFGTGVNLSFRRYDDSGLAYNPYSLIFTLTRSTGRIHMGGINGDCGGAVNIQPLSAATTALNIRRAGQQTANMQEWQHEGGAALCWITYAGRFGQTAALAREQAEETVGHILAQPHLVDLLREALRGQ